MTNKEIMSHLCSKIARKAHKVAREQDITVANAAEEILEAMVDEAADNIKWEEG